MLPGSRLSSQGLAAGCRKIPCHTSRCRRCRRLCVAVAANAVRSRTLGAVAAAARPNAAGNCSRRCAFDRQSVYFRQKDAMVAVPVVMIVPPAPTVTSLWDKLYPDATSMPKPLNPDVTMLPEWTTESPRSHRPRCHRRPHLRSWSCLHDRWSCHYCH